MVEIYCTRPNVKTPKVCGGLWTGRQKAEKALHNFIRLEWDKVNNKRGNARR